jgi:hypothetical protein
MIRMEWQLAAFEATVGRFAKVVNKDIGVVVRQQATLFGKDVLKLTPPLKSWSGQESFGEQRKVGQRRVQIDIRGAFRGLDTHPLARSLIPDVQQAWLKGIRQKDYFALEVLARQMNCEPYIYAASVIDTMSPEAHNRSRGIRGRVRRSAFKHPTWVRKTSDVQRFVRKKQKLVGKAKGGWAPGCLALGVSVPAWVRKHAQGRFSDNTQSGGNSPTFIFINSCSYINYLNREGRIVSESLKRRQVAMERQIKAKTEGRWREPPTDRIAA